MANGRTFQFSTLMALLFAGSTSALSLSNLQLISSTSVSIECLTAYNTELVGCSFQDSSSLRCPGACRNSLTRTQANVQRACGDVLAVDGTVLAAAQSGLLAASVCARIVPDGNQDGGAPIVVTITSRTTVVADETLITAPTQTAIGRLDQDGSPAPMVTSDTVTITTAIVPRPVNGLPTSAPNPPSGETGPNRPPSNQDGSRGRTDGVDSAGASTQPLRAASLFAAAVAGAVLIML
jgi:hypothetical protein